MSGGETESPDRRSACRKTPRNSYGKIIEVSSSLKYFSDWLPAANYRRATYRHSAQLLRSLEIVTVVLAAGASSRLPFHKALLNIGNESMLKRVAKTSLNSSSGRSLVVLGAEAQSLRTELSGLPVEVIENDNYATGRTGSLKSALRHLGGSLADSAVFIFPVDCPFVSHLLMDKLINTLASEWRAADESLWIVPEFGGKRGHPILLSGPVLFSILELNDDFPLRDFLYKAKHTGQNLRQICVPVESEAVLDNINCPGDVLRLWKREGLSCNLLPL